MKFVPFLFNDGKGETLTVNGNCMCTREKELLQVWKIEGIEV